MSWFGAVASFFMGGSKTADTVINDISSGVDKLVFTEQEKNEASIKGFELFLEYQKATLPQNVARRQLAIMMLAFWMFIGLITFGGLILDAGWYKNSFAFFKEISPYVGALWAFYFVKRFIPSGNK